MSNILQRIEDSIKDNLNRKNIIIMMFIVFLTGTLLFGLGYLSGQTSERAPIIIETSN